MIPTLNFETGALNDQEPVAIRRLGDLAEIFRTTVPKNRADEIVYRIYGDTSIDSEEAKLLYAVTVLEPGTVGDEYFMTRGHFHTKPERGEWMMTIRGQGELWLMDRQRNSRTESMTVGSVHNIDGRFAHRVVNTGNESLVFMVVWLSDCGHDYEASRDLGWPQRYAISKLLYE